MAGSARECRGATAAVQKFVVPLLASGNLPCTCVRRLDCSLGSWQSCDGLRRTSSCHGPNDDNSIFSARHEGKAVLFLFVISDFTLIAV